MPDIRSADEQTQEARAHQQGDAYRASYDMLMEEDKHAETEVDQYRITASFEPAEGMYEMDGDGKLHWMVPEKGENQHFEVIAQDRDDGRFIPGLEVRLRLLATDGRPVAATAVPFVWHPFVLHYGVNGTIPGEGDYLAEVTIKAPTFGRHDEVRGRRYERDVTVRLGPLHLKPGVKPHGPE